MSAIVQATSMGLTPEALRAMGIDLTISKDDLLKVMSDQIERSHRSAIDVATEKHKAAQDRMNKAHADYYVAQRKRVAELAVTKKLQSVLEDVYGMEYHVVHWLNQPVPGKVSFTLAPITASTHGAGVAYSVTRSHEEYSAVQRAPIPKVVRNMYANEKLSTELAESYRELQAANEEWHKIKHKIKQAHISVIRSLLTQTDKGTALLAIIDKGAQSGRAAAAVDAAVQSDHERYRHQSVLRYKGALHFVYAEQDKTACGRPLNTVKRHSTDPEDFRDATGVCRHCQHESPVRYVRGDVPE